MKNMLLIILLLVVANADEIKPKYKLHASGAVKDFTFDKNYLYAATDEGVVDIFDLKTKKIVHQIVLDDVVSGIGDKVRPKVCSVDLYNSKLVLVSTAQYGYRNVWIYKDGGLKKVVDASKQLSIKEARFIDDEKIIFGTFASEAILFDFNEAYKVYSVQLSGGNQGDITLSDDRTKLFSADESGEITVSDVKTSNIIKTYSGMNVDKVFYIAYEKGTLLTAGQDRRVGVYRADGEDYYLKSGFFVYCVGMNKSATVGVFYANENNDLQAFDIKSKKYLNRFVGHRSLVTQIKFVDDTHFFSSGRERDIFFWSLQ